MLMTPPVPGAIAVVQLFGDVTNALAALTGIDAWPVGRHRLVTIEDIDDAVVGRLTDDVAQVMPHGGVRVIQRLAARLIELGIATADSATIDVRSLYPEASDLHEALMLHALARAASPLAIDLLLDQPRRWRALIESGRTLAANDLARSKRLNRLIDPPRVVVAGPANVGKSTLANALLGRSMSITLDQPGTTRDYTVGRIELAGLVVDWHDTPGLRATDDPIELKAIDLAQRLIESCDLLIAMTDHEHDWPSLPRPPDLRVVNKIDLEREGAGDAGRAANGWNVRRISATRGDGLARIVQTVRDALVYPEDLAHGGPWLFDERLVALQDHNPTAL